MKWKETVELVGLVAVVGSLVFLALIPRDVFRPRRERPAELVQHVVVRAPGSLGHVESVVRPLDNMQ